MNLPEYGLHLFFEGTSQKLRLIEVYDLTRVQVRHRNATVGGASHPATFDALYDLAGPTYPGHIDNDNQSYVMHWPGVLAVFQATPAQAASWQAMQQGKAHAGALSGEVAPAAGRLCIFAGSAVGLSEMACVKPPVPASPLNALTKSVQIAVGKGIVLTASQQQLCFGDTPQDAWSILGVPSNTHSKQGPTAPHARPSTPPAPLAKLHTSAANSDYFYNYFARGLDLLFDGHTHQIKKIVLHTNAHDHTHFGVHNKCHFTLEPLQSQQSPTSSAEPSQAQQPEDAVGHDRSKKHWQPQQQQQQQEGSPTVHGKLLWDLHDTDPQQQKYQQQQYQQQQLQEQAEWPVQEWLTDAEGARRGSCDTGTSGGAASSMQQALLSDIVAMARAASSDSDSSSISQQTHTYVHALPNQGVIPIPPTIARQDTQHNERQEALGAADAAGHAHTFGQDNGEADSAGLGEQFRGYYGEEADEARLEGWEGQLQTGRASPMDGWDDMDPMALLSQSVQLPSEAHTSRQSGTLSEQAPLSALGGEGGCMEHTAVSDHGSQAIQSHPVSSDTSQTPSSIATLPLMPAPSSSMLQSDDCLGHIHREGQGTTCSSPHNTPAVPHIAPHSSSPAGHTLTADSCWLDFEKNLGPGCQAIIHSRGGGAPFGSTTVHGYPGLVFEVTQSGHVATVALFKQ